MNDLYYERAQLVALLSKIFPASIEEDPRQPDWNVVIIDLPSGQVSWHISRSDLGLFLHLPRDSGRIWDGHSTQLKYERIENFQPKDVLESEEVRKILLRFIDQLERLHLTIKSIHSQITGSEPQN